MKVIRTDDKILKGKALALASSVFMEYEAPDYPAEGVKEFKLALADPNYIDNLCYYIAVERHEIIGMLATRDNGTHIGLLFVNGDWHRKGIGRKLVEYALRCCKSVDMTVNSAPHAHEFYKQIGFVDANVEQINKE